MKLKKLLGYDKCSDRSEVIFRTITLIGIAVIWWIAIFFVICQLFIPHEVERGKCYYLNDGWMWETDKGVEGPYSFPHRFDIKSGDEITVYNTIPDNVEDGMYFYIKSGRNYKIFIDDELRLEFNNADVEYPGKVVKAFYNGFKLTKADRGKRITIYKDESRAYNGTFNAMMYGEISAMDYEVFKQNSMTFVLAVILFLLSLTIIIFGWVVKYRTENDLPIRILGNGIILIALWAICDSYMFQFVFNNYFIDGYVSYMLMGVLPIPFYRYLNKIQERRYESLYSAMTAVQLVIAIGSQILQVTNVLSFEQTRVFINCVIGAACLTIVFTIGNDAIKRRIDQYRLVVFGFIILSISAVIELILINTFTNIPDGISILIGLYFLLGTALIHSVNRLRTIEKEHQEALNASMMKSSFLANMSHEIRTPINSIMGMNEMILRENKNPDIQEYAEYIDRSSKLLIGIISDILDFSKIEAGKINIESSRYDIAALMRDMSALLEELASQKNLRAVVTASEKIPKWLKGDRLHIQQILINVISNAVKYTEEGSITFNAHIKKIDMEKCLLCFRISDTGIGMHQEDVDQIFESFSRFDEKRNKNIQGTGLGMAITKRLVNLLGGSINIVSEYNKGTSVMLEFPQDIESDELIGNNWKNRKKKQDEGKYQVSFVAPSARILAVDDNSTNLLIIKQYLKRTDVRLDMCNNGKEAVEMCNEKEYDIILLDHMMPVMDGIEAINIIRNNKDNANSDIPIIALTANAISGSREFYLDNGFDDYLTKPVNSKNFEDMIKKYLPEDKITIINE